MTVENEQESDFFATNPAPKNLPQISAKLHEFLEFHQENGNLNKKKIVLVTSGGTTVPLENNTVRFIDNFSAGTRGSLSAEYFLNNGYLVIFLHREFSLLPFLNHFGNINFLDLLQIENDGQKLGLDKNKVSKLNSDHNLLKVLKNYKYHTANRNYLSISFTTINEYLFTLRAISEDLKNFYEEKNFRILIYLAAAVSDFFIPQSELPEHKIQSNLAILEDPQYQQSQNPEAKQIEISSSTNGKLKLNLDPVPKFLKTIVDRWYNNSFIISFKLETDDGLLIKKCKQALARYDHQLVIGNLLQSRKEKVVFVNKNIDQQGYKEDWFKLKENEILDGVQIESIFIPELIKLHDNWIDHFESK
ncbi:phosphopantothenate--cysteine ligase [Saccharomycopsis crataegensis]|uniref:Phosphopantothenate--cysteine ligase n=1 Tax=Saccharomycopsis crataegensis TaxID=43959 RepID=A0AAV5QL74_9ASCO|nr:phosphopantothenate--cysteine ligase [Saccharomycopsis crataegensis]